MSDCTVVLSRCRWWKTADGAPNGQRGFVTHVRCPDSRHCLRLVPLVDGRIGEHERNIGGVCPWIGFRVVDDRREA
jgi:hypothetical protein